METFSDKIPELFAGYLALTYVFKGLQKLASIIVSKTASTKDDQAFLKTVRAVNVIGKVFETVFGLANATIVTKKKI